MRIVFALAVVGLLSQAHGHPFRSVPYDNGQASKYCTDCVNFFGDLKEVLSSPTSAADIVKLLDQVVCKQMWNMKDRCRILVEQLVPRFMAYLAGMPDGKQICGLIGMCREYAVTLLNEVQLKDVLENRVCPLLGSLSEKCKENAETNAALIFHLMVNEPKPALLCDSTHPCKQKNTKTMLDTFRATWNSSPSNVKVMSQLKVEDGIQCTLCEIAVRTVKELLAKKATLEAIEKALTEMCKYLSPSMSQECDAFVQEYVPLIIDLLRRQIPPQQICQMLHLC